MLYVGARIGYYSGSVTKLMGDILSLRPTLFIAPPRVWDRVYAGTMAKLNQPRLLAEGGCFAGGGAGLEHVCQLGHGIAAALVLASMQRVWQQALVDPPKRPHSDEICMGGTILRKCRLLTHLCMSSGRQGTHVGPSQPNNVHHRTGRRIVSSAMAASGELC